MGSAINSAWVIERRGTAIGGTECDMNAGTLPAVRQNLKRRFCRSHLRAALADTGAACLSAVHDRFAEVRAARVVSPDGVGVAVGVDGNTDEVEQVAVAAEQTANALLANVAAMH